MLLHLFEPPEHLQYFLVLQGLQNNISELYPCPNLIGGARIASLSSTSNQPSLFKGEKKPTPNTKKQKREIKKTTFPLTIFLWWIFDTSSKHSTRLGFPRRIKGMKHHLLRQVLCNALQGTTSKHDPKQSTAKDVDTKIRFYSSWWWYQPI